MLQYEVFGNSLQTWIISILIVIGAVIVVKLLSLLGRKVLEPLVKRTHTRVDDIVYYSIEPPLKFAVMLLGIWIALHHLVYPDGMVKYIDNAYRILIILDITWVFARLLSALLLKYWGRKSTAHIQKMMPVINRTLLVVVWIIGVITALSNVGVDINALWGTLGIGGVALALAAQDTVKNILGAVTIFTDKPFGIGDTINVNGVEGTVVDVGLRSTRIRGYDQRITTIPNYKVTDANIVDISSEPMRRVMVKLGLTYDTGAEKMQEALNLLKSLPAKVKDVSADPSNITVVFAEYGDSALVLNFYYFIEKQGNILQAMSDMNMAILAAFDKAGLEFAFPTQTVYVHGDEEAASAPSGTKSGPAAASADVMQDGKQSGGTDATEQAPVGKADDRKNETDSKRQE